jgi:hypothetical protein
MTLDEAIKICEEDAEKIGGNPQSDRHAERCRQFAEWLTELKQWRRVYGVCPSYEMCIPECKEGYNAQIAEYKRLLKAAVEDINYYVDCYEAHCDECCCDHDNRCHWKHEAEALALIGEDGVKNE